MAAQSLQSQSPRSFSLADDIDLPLDRFLDFQSFISRCQKTTYRQQNKPIINRLDFLKLITLYLPEVAAHITESEFGNVHLEVGAVRRATQNAITESDFSTVRKHLQLIADLFERANTELYIAICISYLEALFLERTSMQHLEARKLLPKSMEHALRRVERNMERGIA